MQIGLFQVGIAPTLLLPQFDGRFVWIQTDGNREVRAANTLVASIQPCFADMYLVLTNRKEDCFPQTFLLY